MPFGLGKKKDKKKEEWMKKLGLTESDLDKIYATRFLFIGFPAQFVCGV